MREYLKFYIDGQWIDPVTPKTAEVINPATEGVSGTISLGSAADVDKAVAAAAALSPPGVKPAPKDASTCSRRCSPHTSSASASWAKR